MPDGDGKVEFAEQPKQECAALGADNAEQCQHRSQAGNHHVCLITWRLLPMHGPGDDGSSWGQEWVCTVGVAGSKVVGTSPGPTPRFVWGGSSALARSTTANPTTEGCSPTHWRGGSSGLAVSACGAAAPPASHPWLNSLTLGSAWRAGGRRAALRALRGKQPGEHHEASE